MNVKHLIDQLLNLIEEEPVWADAEIRVEDDSVLFPAEEIVKCGTEDKAYPGHIEYEGNVGEYVVIR